MLTRHLWIRSGPYSLLAHLDLPEVDLPETGSGCVGVIIVPPFGWEDICSYRSLRSIAKDLATAGIPTMRFDLPGTGDSSGSASDADLVGAWTQSVADAAAEFKIMTGVSRVAILGVRLGAMIALQAASGGAPVDDLVLWGASTTGRSVLREMRAFRNMESTEYDEGVQAEGQPGLEVAGFYMNAETESALERLDFSHMLRRMPGRRVLLLSRDNFPHDKKLIEALERCGCEVSALTGAGYSDMMAFPHDAIPPVQTAREITRFFQEERQGDRAGDLAEAAATVASRSASPEPGIQETILPLPRPGGSMFSILTQPIALQNHAGWCLLFLNPGGVRHVGPNRMWVEAARRWARQGIPSLRMDFEAVGESDGNHDLSVAGLYQDDLVGQLATAIEALRFETRYDKFLAVGLCSGAFGAFQGILHNPAIRAAILMNPRLFFWDPDVDKRRLERRVVTGLGAVSDWRRLVRGEIQLGRVKQAARLVFHKLLHKSPKENHAEQIPKAKMAQAWRKIEKSRSQVTLIFADNEPLLAEMESENQMPPSGNPAIRCIRAGRAGHTFRPLWAQKLGHELIDREIEQMMANHAEWDESTIVQPDFPRILSGLLR